jgi:hypothetical protein
VTQKSPSPPEKSKVVGEDQEARKSQTSSVDELSDQPEKTPLSPVSNAAPVEQLAAELKFGEAVVAPALLAQGTEMK